MAYFNWDNAYSVGVKEFDDHHKHLVEMVSQLHEAMRAGKASQELGAIIDSLIGYTQSHFSAEEALMAKHGYLGLRKHKVEHDALKAQVMDFREKVVKGQLGLSIEVSKFLKDWLTSHIALEDKKYAAFFQSKGIS